MCLKEGGPAAEVSERGFCWEELKERGVLNVEVESERTVIIAFYMLTCHTIEKW